jgi:hypothetical protein
MGKGDRVSAEMPARDRAAGGDLPAREFSEPDGRRAALRHPGPGRAFS